MSKLVATYMLVFILFAYFSSVAEGGGGVVATQLTSDINSTVTTVPVADTTGFLAAGSIIIDDEEIAYSGTTAVSFTGCTRSYRGTIAESHNDERIVYAPASGVLNRSLGFNVISTGEAYGTMAVVNITWTFLTKSIGYLVTFNFGILGGQMVYLRYLLMAPAVGFIIYFGFMALSTAFGILRR